MIFVNQVPANMNERVFAAQAVINAGRCVHDIVGIFGTNTVVETILNSSRVVQIDPKARPYGLNGYVRATASTFFNCSM
jgi:hypothetical protein